MNLPDIAPVVLECGCRHWESGRPARRCIIHRFEAKRAKERRYYNRRADEKIELGEIQRDRFLAKLEPEPNSGCWIWLAARSDSGYGRFSVGVTALWAHRCSYEFFVGPIPKGLQIDHLCRNRACVNPRHLEPVTALINGQRSPLSPIGRHYGEARCPQGHEPDWRYGAQARGKRRTCRACHRDKERNRRLPVSLR